MMNILDYLIKSTQKTYKVAIISPKIEVKK